MQVAAVSTATGSPPGNESSTSHRLTRSQSVKQNNDQQQPPQQQQVKTAVKIAELNNAAAEPGENSELVNELERLKKDKLKAFYEIERYKKLITYAIIFSLFMLMLSVTMVVWRFTKDKPTFEEMRKKVMSTTDEEPHLCVTVYPNAITKTFDKDEVGEPLMLTPLIERGEYEEAAKRAKVDHIMQSEKSYSGFLTVNQTYNSSLFFWYFPASNHPQEAPPTVFINRGAAADEDDEDEDAEEDIPLILWLQGGPGWPTMYGLFKENGPFLVGYDPSVKEPYLVKNKFSWTRDHHMLYIDNPVGAGFSFTEDEDGFPRSDQQASVELLEALRQFMLLFPHMTRRQGAQKTRFYAFGESYGGTYVVSLAKAYIEKRDEDPEYVENINFSGIGIGNGFVSSEHQSLYAEYFSMLGYITEEEHRKLKALDDELIRHYNAKNYPGVINSSQASLHMFASDIMNLTNIYDFTANDNYLTNHEYVCFLQQDRVRKGIHAGDVVFHRGYDIYTYLNESIMVSKKPWLDQVLRDGRIEVLIYNGNLDVIVHVVGTNNMVKSLDWQRSDKFFSADRRLFWVWNDDNERGELAGYLHEGGGLTYLVVRNAGHMVPISQPRWARQIAYEFTRKKSRAVLDEDAKNEEAKEKKKAAARWEKPKEIKPKLSTAFYDCIADGEGAGIH